MAGLDNPYWDGIKHLVKPSEFYWEGPQIQRWNMKRVESGEIDADFVIADRDDWVKQYSWTVTDPESVEFVAEHAIGGLVDPMAGTGYWAYVLSQLNVDVKCYDLRPGGNPWHRDKPLHVEISQMDAVEAVRLHPDRTLLLAWPPYDDGIGNRIVQAYKGERVIYMGEGPGGCTGDDDLHRRLDRWWVEVDEREPVQWYGLRDRITVYTRKTRSRSPKTRAHSHADGLS